ncbi:hypothetical protein V1478_015637 [Vespula squamosa]|uniref:Uncharacterized protein n=1 Tax=Vespula squamosa TaxID=30214 RepID=A0ABD2A1F2_VESSQ
MPNIFIRSMLKVFKRKVWFLRFSTKANCRLDDSIRLLSHSLKINYLRKFSLAARPQTTINIISHDINFIFILFDEHIEVYESFNITKLIVIIIKHCIALNYDIIMVYNRLEENIERSTKRDKVGEIRNKEEEEEEEEEEKEKKKKVRKVVSQSRWYFRSKRSVKSPIAYLKKLRKSLSFDMLNGNGGRGEGDTFDRGDQNIGHCEDSVTGNITCRSVLSNDEAAMYPYNVAINHVDRISHFNSTHARTSVRSLPPTQLYLQPPPSTPTLTFPHSYIPPLRQFLLCSFAQKTLPNPPQSTLWLETSDEKERWRLEWGWWWGG